MSTSPHRNPPFRAEHMGSLLRPKALLDTRHAWEAGKETGTCLRTTEDAAVSGIVKTQIDLGFHGINDGEYRRHMFWGSFWNDLEGMSDVIDPTPDMFRMYIPGIAAYLKLKLRRGEIVVCTGKIKHKGTSTYLPELNYLKSLVPEWRWKEIKLTVAAPNWYHWRYKQGKAYPSEVYHNDDEYFADVAVAYQEELHILYQQGLRNIQFDDPALTYFCSETVLTGWKEDHLNTYSAEDCLLKYIDTYNAIVANIPSDMHVGVHLCRGNYANSQHWMEGAYDRIAQTLFEQANFHTFYLEYDSPRAKGFEPLQYLPKNKNVILGVVTSKHPQLENEDEMVERVMQAARCIGKATGESEADALARCGVSPQCGFASHSSGNAVTHEDMIAKLKLVRQIADRLWPGEP